MSVIGELRESLSNIREVVNESLSFVDLLDEDKVLLKIKKDINMANLKLGIANSMVSLLQSKFVGKKITKRIATAMEQDPALRGYKLYVDIPKGSFGGIHVYLWGKEIDYRDQMIFTIGEKKQYPEVDMNYIMDKNQGYLSLNAERIKKLESSLKDVSRLVSEWNKHFQALKNIHKEAAKYDLQYTFDIS